MEARKKETEIRLTQYLELDFEERNDLTENPSIDGDDLVMEMEKIRFDLKSITIE